MTNLLAQISGINSPSTVFTNYSTIVPELTSRLLLYGITVAGLVFFVQLLVGGYGYLTAMGDSAKITAATQGITRAVVGLIVVVSAYFIGQIMQVILGVQLGL
jgi:hypothetical protein